MKRGLLAVLVLAVMPIPDPAQASTTVQLGPPFAAASSRASHLEPAHPCQLCLEADPPAYWNGAADAAATTGRVTFTTEMVGTPRAFVCVDQGSCLRGDPFSPPFPRVESGRRAFAWGELVSTLELAAPVSSIHLVATIEGIADGSLTGTGSGVVGASLAAPDVTIRTGGTTFVNLPPSPFRPPASQGSFSGTREISLTLGQVAPGTIEVRVRVGGWFTLSTAGAAEFSGDLTVTSLRAIVIP